MPRGESTRLERIQSLFDDVLDMPTIERVAFLKATGEVDASVLREVEELVLASREAPGFLDRPAAISELEGQMAGPWRIESLLASGGMADVFRAVRDDAELSWSVAVKVLKPGLAAEQLVQLFRAEQRVLATLSHPNIVGLLDVGTLSDGRLYLAMELVDGVPITRHCAQEKLDLRQRLTLFLQCCKAVQYAHQRLVVHCDLKPSNIFVARDGVPKVLDFGISTLLGHSGSSASSTPAITMGYASPEQLRGEVLGATTDIFNLGVVLYELVTSRRAFDVAGLTLAEVVAQQATPPRSFEPRDLNAVVLKAIHSNPAQRYSSVEQLAADIQRFLDHRPVEAQPTSFVTRATKFLRRNRLASTAAVLVVLSLAFGALGIYQSMLSAREEARLGWRAHTQAVQVSRFLEDMMRDLNQSPASRAPTRAELLDRAAFKIESTFADFPETEGRLRLAIAQLYLDIELSARATPHLVRAIEIINTHRGFGSPDRARATNLLARANSMTSTQPSLPR